MPSNRKYKEAYKTNDCQVTIEKLKKAIRLLEKEGCSCDLLNGYYCGIHATVAKLLKEN